LTSGGFRIVFDTLVIIIIQRFNSSKL